VREIFESPYITNLLLLAAVFLLFRIAQILRELYALKANSETTIKILHQGMPDRAELMRVISFLADEQAKSRDKQHEIARQLEAILDRLAGRR
jgi:hypothetical protein